MSAGLRWNYYGGWARTWKACACPPVLVLRVVYKGMTPRQRRKFYALQSSRRRRERDAWLKANSL